MARVVDNSDKPKKAQAHEVTIKTMTKTKSGWKVNYDKTIPIHPREQDSEEG
jgi:hypothetical protein